MSRLLYLATLCWLTLAGMAQATDEPRPSAEQFEALFASNATDAELNSLLKRVALQQATRGEFSQTRWLKVLKKPLQSSGQLLFSPELGLWWHQQKPFASTMILQQDALTQIDSQGNVSKQQAAGAPSQLASLMPQLLQALLSGDVAFLQQHFTLSLQQQGEQWQLGLVAKDAQLQAMLPRLVLSGDQQLQRLLMLGQQQDSSVIEFSALQQGALSSDEQQRFNAGAD
ncbi:outer membrane lipoprotein carrier protein LolA [Shewanella sp. A3A]|nr:outer membrane lipoprotein carrier protein LolA [Shewanella ferrihydritica]